MGGCQEVVHDRKLCTKGATKIRKIEGGSMICAIRTAQMAEGNTDESRCCVGCLFLAAQKRLSSLPPSSPNSCNSIAALACPGLPPLPLLGLAWPGVVAIGR